MKILLKRCTIFAISFILLSCQEMISQETATQDTIVLPTQTNSLPISETITPATLIPVSITPDTIAAGINFLPELRGSLFIGSYDSGVYIEIDFDHDKVSRYQLPGGCQLLSGGLKAVCEVNPFTDNAEIYIYDVIAERRGFTEQGVGRWDLTSSEQILAYTRASPDGIGISIHAYDFETNTSSYVGTFNNKGATLSLPWLSNSANSMIGLDMNGPFDDDDSWYVMDTSTMEDEPITVPENIAATNSIEWSPNNALIALVGFYRDDERALPGALTCGKEVLIYDPILKNVKSRIEVPKGRCYDPFYIHPLSIWSPDSSKLALVLDQQDICIIDMLGREPACSLITNYYSSEHYISRLSWSPDSRYVAFIAGDDTIQVYSINDEKTYHIADLSTSPIGSDLVWGN
jgi:WD40 repeat protein